MSTTTSQTTTEHTTPEQIAKSALANGGGLPDNIRAA